MKTVLAPEKPEKAASTPRTFANILVAVDPAFDTEHLLAVAAGIGKRFAAHVSLLYVLPAGELDPGDPAQRSALHLRGEHGIRDCADVMKIRHCPCTTMVRTGDIVPEVHSVVREQGIDLVIVGSAGASGLQKVRLGSVAEGLLRTLKVPVLTVGPEVPRTLGETDFRKILFPVSFDVDPHVACRWVEPIARRFDSHLIMLHTLPVARRHHRQSSELAVAYQRKLEETLPCHGQPFRVDYVVNFGRPAEVILQTAHTWEADLVALPVRRSNSLASHLPGHIAYEVIRRSPCPVLTVRA